MHSQTCMGGVAEASRDQPDALREKAGRSKLQGTVNQLDWSDVPVFVMANFCGDLYPIWGIYLF